MNRQKILFPYNFTGYDQKALDFVIRTFADQKDTEITLFNVYTSVPEIEVRDSPIMEKMRGNLSYLAQRVREREAELQQVVKQLTAKGFQENRIRTIFEPQKRDVAGDIIDLALADRFDIVILNRNPDRIVRFFTGSVFSKVVKALKNVTVCIIS